MNELESQSTTGSSAAEADRGQNTVAPNVAVDPGERVRVARVPVVEEVTSTLAFAALREEWGALFKASRAHPFLTWEWLYPWYRRTASQHALRVFTARDADGALVGVLPMYEKRIGVGQVGIARWGMLGDETVGSDYLDVLAPAGREAELAKLFAENLWTRRARIDVLELMDLEQGASFIADAILERFSGKALMAERFTRFECPQVEVGTDFDAFMKSKGRFDNYKRRRKWLVAQPGYQVEKITGTATLERGVSDFFRLHDQRWAADGGSAGITGPDFRSFHRDTTWALAESGLLRLYVMRVGEQAVASVYGLMHGDRFYYYQSGYDPEWRNRSVGLVLLVETFRDAIDEKRPHYDFLRGSEPYKFEWSSGLKHIEGVRIVNPSLGGAAFLAMHEGKNALKKVAKAAAGEQRWEQLRKWAGRA